MPNGDRGEPLHPPAREEEAGQAEAEQHPLVLEIQEPGLREDGRHAVLPSGVPGKGDQHEKMPDLVERQVDERECSPRRPDDDGSQQRPDRGGGHDREQDGEERVRRDVLREQRHAVGAGTKEQHVPERKAAHVAVDEVEGEDENAEDDVIGRALELEEREQEQERSGDQQDVDPPQPLGHRFLSSAPVASISARVASSWKIFPSFIT